MRIYFLSFFSCLLLLPVVSFSQDQKIIDSLTSIAQKKIEDTTSISAYIKLSLNTVNSDYQKSLGYALSGLDIAQKLDDNFWKGRCYYQMGYTHSSFGYNKESIENYNDAISYYEKWAGNKSYIGRCYNGIGNSQKKLGRYKDATENYLAAKNIYGEVNDKRGIAGVTNNLGIILLAQGQSEKARDYFMLARQMNIEINNKPWLGINLMNIGTTFFNVQQYDSAEFYFIKSKDIYADLNDMGNWSNVIMNLGNVYLAEKDYKKAMNQYNDALVYDQKNGKYDDMAFLFTNIAELYLKTNDFAKAKNALDSSLMLSIKYSDAEALDQAYQGYAALYEQTGDYKNANDFYKLYATMKDSMTTSTMKNQMDEMEESFREETLKEKNSSLEQSKQLQDISLNRSHIINYAAIGGGILILLLSITLLKRYQLKKKANIELEERNHEIEIQKAIIEEKNKDISDSINYAKKIQDTLLPDVDEIKSFFKESFVFFRPKNVVSGDFYWFANRGKKMLIAAADCTGHGVPGAFMSMIGIDKINQAVLEFNVSRPNEILSTVNRWLKTILKQDDLTGGMRDGMDVALISIDRENMMLEYSGANRPLWIIRNEELIELKPNKVSLGGFTPTTQEFTSHEFALQKNDCIYLFTDGYADQFGGERGKKLMTKNFKRLLLSFTKEKMETQKRILAEKFDKWKDNLEQVDDICVMGLCIQ